MGYVVWSVIAGEQPTAAKWNILGTNDASFNDGTGIGTGAVWLTWSPTWGSVTIGNGTVVARYAQFGKIVHGFVSIVFGSTSTMATGVVTFTAPVAMNSSWTPASSLPQIGVARAGGATNTPDIPIRAETTTTFDMVLPSASGTFIGEATFGAATPFAWTTGNSLAGTFAYEAA